MKNLKLTASVILLVGLAHIAYGAFAICVASLTAADLPAKISQEINATGATWEAWKVSFARGGAFGVGMGLVAMIAGGGIFKNNQWIDSRIDRPPKTS